VIEMLETFTVAFPTLCTVILIGRLSLPTGTLPKFKLAGVRSTSVPVPVTLIFCGLFVALSAITTEPDRNPIVSGVNAMLTVQLAPDATTEPQVLLSAKSTLSFPATRIDAIFNGAMPVLVKATGMENYVRQVLRELKRNYVTSSELSLLWKPSSRIRLRATSVESAGRDSNNTIKKEKRNNRGSGSIGVID
jgi:hypothetical protein